MSSFTAGVIVIGDEILSGRTQDTNSNYIAKKLLESGIKLEEVVVIQDDKKTIIENVLEYSSKYSYVFTTGGIGPTHDDITAKSISKAFKVKYEYHREAYLILEKYYGKKNFNDGRKKMAKMPKGAKLIYNPSSAAPGFMIKNVLSLPGVPSILNSMIENCKKYLIKGLKVNSKTINLFTVESNISLQLASIQQKYKRFVDIGSYPFFRLGKIGVSIVLRSEKKTKLQSCHKEIIKMLTKKKLQILKGI